MIGDGSRNADRCVYVVVVVVGRCSLGFYGRWPVGGNLWSTLQYGVHCLPAVIFQNTLGVILTPGYSTP